MNHSLVWPTQHWQHSTYKLLFPFGQAYVLKWIDIITSLSLSLFNYWIVKEYKKIIIYKYIYIIWIWIWLIVQPYTHTHTHTHARTQRERKRDRGDGQATETDTGMEREKERRWWMWGNVPWWGHSMRRELPLLCVPDPKPLAAHYQLWLSHLKGHLILPHILLLPLLVLLL